MSPASFVQSFESPSLAPDRNELLRLSDSQQSNTTSTATIVDSNSRDFAFSSHEKEFFNRKLLHAATSWSLSTSFSTSSHGTTSIIPHFPKALEIATLAQHFHSQKPEHVTDEEIKEELYEAVNELPRDRFISVRSLTHLDAVIGLAFRKYGSNAKAAEMLKQKLGIPTEHSLSRPTKTFLTDAINILSQERASCLSLRDMLTKLYKDTD